MSDYKYTRGWNEDGLAVSCYVHQVKNFRYHWHADEFELSILLQGKQHFYQGSDLYDFAEDDLLLINPNTGHASYCDPEGTIALVIHFPEAILNRFANKGKVLRIEDCLTDEKTRYDERYRQIRFCAGMIMKHIAAEDEVSGYLVKAALEMLAGTICTMFEARTETSGHSDEEKEKMIRMVLRYLDRHYSEKITLEEVANMTGYNRTYFSTFFRQTVGIRFYDYLMRIRVQNAIRELIITDHSLTDIAADNGFTDLKSFNERFRSMLKILPSEYRGMLVESSTDPAYYYSTDAIPLSDPLVQRKIREYTLMGCPDQQTEKGG